MRSFICSDSRDTLLRRAEAPARDTDVFAGA